MTDYRCTACAESYPVVAQLWRCSCGGVLDLAHDVPRRAFSRLGAQPWSLWRYRDAIPALAARSVWRQLTLGEGCTPLVAGKDAMLKLDFLMPTLSFKDRGSVVLLAAAAELGVRRVVADSSGNAGVSIAAYAARAGITAEVFVPSSTSAKKVAQLGAFGATVVRVHGSRADTAAAAIERVDSTGSFYASHVYNPFFLHGTKTFAFELWEQLGHRLPDCVVLPAGNGTLLIGASLGFAELVTAGVAERSPRLVAVQAARCAPLAVGAGTAQLGPTVAEGIAIAEPPRREQMLAAIAASGGTVLTADDDEIMAAKAELAGRGIDVEPTAAAAYAAWRSWPGAEAAGRTVVALTGAGLKAPADTAPAQPAGSMPARPAGAR